MGKTAAKSAGTKPDLTVGDLLKNLEEFRTILGWFLSWPGTGRSKMVTTNILFNTGDEEVRFIVQHC